MKTLQLIQGSAEWVLHRGSKFNASDAPAMLGVSPYKTRSQLLDERATGVAQEVDPATQRRFDDGHRFEALARPHAEQIIGDELFPCVGEEGKLSASFDGLTMDGATAFEHKTLNDEIRAAIDLDHQGDLPLQYRVQMEQQCIVSGCERVLFMASKWDGDVLVEERHCWYYPDAELRDRIIQGWCQFADDLASHNPVPVKAAPVAAPVEGFGALSLRIEGRVLASNLDAFRAGAEAFIARLPKPDDLQTDQDFADADAAVKACAEAESRIKAAKDSAQAQMADVDSAFRLADSVIELIRAARLGLDKVVKTEKEARKAAIVRDGAEAVREHYVTINNSLKAHALGMPASVTAEIGASIKGLRTIKSITDAVDTAVANAKIAASQKADAVRANIAVLGELFVGHEALFPDAVALCASKQPDDLRNLIKARISEHEAKQKAKAEADAESARETIRAEEAEKLRAEQAKPAQEAEPAAPKPADAATPSPVLTDQPLRTYGRRAPAKDRPTDEAIIHLVATTYSVDSVTAIGWLRGMKLPEAKAA